MATCNPTDVRAINGSILEDEEIQPFINAAISILAGALSCLTAKGISTDSQNIACAWLSAHLIASSGVGLSTRLKKSEKFENYSVEYLTSNFSGKGILSTSYGQAANTLTGGCLSQQDKEPAMVCFIG